MGSCYVVGCHSGDNSRKEHHKFKVPRMASDDTKREWLKNIPKREDKNWDFSSCRLCHLHFEDQFIIKTRKVMMGQEVVTEVPRKNWSLTPDAVPTKFANSQLPSTFNKILKRRRPLQRRQPEADNLKRCPQVLGNKEADRQDTESTNPNILPVTIAKHFTLPDNWFTQTIDGGIIFHKMTPVLPTGTIPSFSSKMSIQLLDGRQPIITVLGKNVSESYPTTCTHQHEFEDLVKTMDCVNICTGLKNLNIFKEFAGAFRVGSSWHSESCERFISTNSNAVCDKCTHLGSQMRKSAANSIRAAQTKNLRTTETVRVLRIKQFHSEKKIKKLTSTNKELLKAVRLMETRFRLLEDSTLENVIQTQPHLTPQFKLSLLTAAKIQKTKSKNGRRYPADWLLQSLLLKITSPKAYRHLRNQGILPLPSPQHLTRLLKGFPCEFGFSSFVFKQLENQFKHKDRKARQVFIVLDEVKVREAIRFDKSTMNFSGFIDYADFSADVPEGKNTRKEADHALVFMVRTLNSKVTQPVGAFATRGSAPGVVLAKMILSCIVRCEEAGLEVVGVVCDGAANNKAAWKALGVSGDGNQITNKIVNPMNEKRNVHFLTDVPHIFKCIRNNLHKHKCCSFRGKMINWDFYSALFEADTKYQVRAVPKLGLHHINPGPFQKMVVAFAVQIFSKSVADALCYYRDVIGDNNLKYSEGTEEFTRILNSLFDALNARWHAEGLRPGCQRFLEIQEFLGCLSDNDTFASKITLCSLRVTLKSVLDLVTYLCDDVGYDYVLTSKFNQDCLEKFFGILRSYGGDDSHPTVSSFGHLYRLLSVYTPTSKCFTGNVRTDEEVSTCPISYMELLRSMRLSREEELKQYKAKLSDDLLQKIFSLNERDDTNFEDSTITARDGIIYHLSGYVAFRGHIFTDCNECIQKLSDPSYNPSHAALTNIKDLGGLKRPSRRLHKLISSLEPIIENLSPEALRSKDIVSKIIDGLDKVNCSDVGCNNDHSPLLTVRIILYYVTIRLFFLSRIYNREMLSSSMKTKQKMKEAKLK